MIREQVTPEEWQTLCAAPWAVGLYIATAVGGKVQEVHERLTLGAALHRALERDHEMMSSRARSRRASSAAARSLSITASTPTKSPL